MYNQNQTNIRLNRWNDKLPQLTQRQKWLHKHNATWWAKNKINNH